MMVEISEEPDVGAINDMSKEEALDALSIIHVLSKEDIKYELSQIETKFGMTSAEFYRAWKEGRLHGHEAMKLGSYYEFYKDEYE